MHTAVQASFSPSPLHIFFKEANYILIKAVQSSVAEPHHFYAAPSPDKILMRLRQAPAPALL
jgi:hypothetical protein